MWSAKSSPRAIVYLGHEGMEAFMVTDSATAELAERRETPLIGLGAQTEATIALAKAGALPSCKVIVSDRWLRYLTVAWSPDFLRRREARTYACEELESAFGMSFDQWRLWRVPGTFGLPQLVIACPPELIALEQVLADATTRRTRLCNPRIESMLMNTMRLLAPWVAAGDHVAVRDGLTHVARVDRNKMVGVDVRPRYARSPALPSGASLLGGAHPSAREWMLDLEAERFEAPATQLSKLPAERSRRGLLTWLAQ